MKRYILALALIVMAASPLWSVAQEQRRQPETWYERAVRQINPSDTDYGAVWEQYKQQFVDRLRDPYFRYGFATTLAIVVLLSTMCAQYVSHRRAMGIAVQSIADIRRHDEYARRAAREAIERYNEHIEKCNRMVEADESGMWKWISTTELGKMKSEIRELKDELKAAEDEIRRLNAELEAKSTIIADMSLRSQKSSPEIAPSSPSPTPPAHIQRINQLELELNLEKKKNQRLKGTALDARHS